MADVFVAYSGRNIQKVADIVNALSEAIGSERVWFAPDRLLVGNDIREQLSEAISQADFFLNFETPTVQSLSRSTHGKRQYLQRRDQLLMFEREEARKKGLRIINVALRGANAISPSFAGYPTVNLAYRRGSPGWQSSIDKLVDAVRD